MHKIAVMLLVAAVHIHRFDQPLKKEVPKMAMNSNENPVTVVGHRGNPRAEIRSNNMMSDENLACPDCSHNTSLDSNGSSQSSY